MKKQIWVILIVGMVSLFCATSLCGAKERAVMSINPEPGHYFVFQLDGATIKLLHHKPVQMIGLVSKSEDEVSTLAEKSAGAPNLVAHVFGATGEILHRDLIVVQKEVRAEFHSADGSGKIDGYSWDAEKPVFVVRIPMIDGAERLRLQNHRPKLSGQSLQMSAMTAEPEIAFELNIKDLVRKQAAEASLISEPAPDILALGGDGPSFNRRKILVLSEGYRPEEHAKFFSDAQKTYDGLLSIPPYRRYKNAVKGTALFVPSRESGADHPFYKADCASDDCCSDPAEQYDSKAGTFVDTAFDGRFCAGNIQRCLWVNTDKVLAAAAAVPDWNIIFVIANVETYGGCAGGKISAFSTNGSMVGVAQHEFKHQVDDAADEYDYGCDHNCICYEPDCSYNVTSETSRERIKWGLWILQPTQIPTPSPEEFYKSPVGPPEQYPYWYVVGLFEGAQYTTEGMYRPQYDCAMRSLGSPFCAICSQEYILRLYRDGIDMIDSENPAPGNIIATESQPINFKVDTLQLVGDPTLEIVWLVNGVQVASGVNYFSYVASQSVEVKVIVKDTTELVHPLMAGDLLETSRVWNVIVESVSASTIIGPTAGVITKTYSFSAGGSVSNFGSPVQYFFDWGDGSNSGWLPTGTASASKSWSLAGIYPVNVRARSATNQAVVSDWSTTLVVSIIAESISAPSITGPATGKPNTSYTYLVSSAKCNLGHDVQYFLDWGDSTNSGWLAVGQTTASKFWTSLGIYTVKIQARCATNPNVVSLPAELEVVIRLPKIFLSLSLSGVITDKPAMTVDVSENLIVAVSGEDSKSLTGASLSLTGSSINLNKIIGKSGKIVFNSISPLDSGEILIRIQKVGYEPGQVIIKVVSNEFYIDVYIKGKTGKQKTVTIDIKNLAQWQKNGRRRAVKGAKVTFSASNMKTTTFTTSSEKISLSGKNSIVSGDLSISIAKRGYIDRAADINIPFEDVNQTLSAFSVPRD